MNPNPAPAPILFRDDVLLILNKPSGLAVHRGWAREDETLLSIARRIARRHVFPCHRLDRGTSGAVVFALSSEIAASVQRQFDTQNVQKWYLAWVRGCSPESALIDHAIAKEPGAVKRDARTIIQRLATVEFPNPKLPKYPLKYSLTAARPLTGRLHQLRRHLKHVSHPIIGDTKYGKAEHNRYCAAAFGLQRLGLHAAHLTLTHPYSGEELQLQAPLPDDFSLPLINAGMGAAVASYFSQPPWRSKAQAS